MNKPSNAAAEMVEHIRAILPTVTDADVFVSSSGDVLIDTGETIIHVSEYGHTQETAIEWSTGWDA